MKEIKEIQENIARYLTTVVPQVQPASLYDPIRYLMDLPAKRLRPALSIMGADLFMGNPADALPAAAAVELFHNFTLMHDDIMDNAPLRRGQKTVHEKWSRAQAILSGDALLVLAYKELEKLDRSVQSEVFSLFNKTALEVCEGQQLDMDFESRTDVSEEEYLEMIRLKTSVLLASALQMGAIVAGASEEDQKHVYDAGIGFGMSFQLRDDYLDTFGDESFGKKIGGDILADKKTYLLIRSMETAVDQDQAVLDRFVGSSAYDDATKVAEVRGVMQRLRVDIQTDELAHRYFESGVEALGKLTVSDDRKRPLISLAEQLLSRKI